MKVTIVIGPSWIVVTKMGEMADYYMEKEIDHMMDCGSRRFYPKRDKPKLNVTPIPEEEIMKERQRYVLVAYKWNEKGVNLGKAYCFKADQMFGPGTLLVVGTELTPTFVRVVCMTQNPEDTEKATKPILGVVTWQPQQ